MALVKINIPGIGEVTAENAASEDTLLRLVDAIEKQTASLAKKSGGGAAGSATGGSGGSGVVIIRSALPAASTTGSPTTTTVDGQTVYTFTSSGSITF